MRANEKAELELILFFWEGFRLGTNATDCECECEERWVGGGPTGGVLQSQDAGKAGSPGSSGSSVGGILVPVLPVSVGAIQVLSLVEPNATSLSFLDFARFLVLDSFSISLGPAILMQNAYSLSPIFTCPHLVCAEFNSYSVQQSSNNHPD